MKLEEIQLAKKHAYIKENYENWNFLEAFSASDDYKTEPIDFYFEFKKSSTCSLAELVKKEHRYICNDGYIKEHSIDDLSECIVVHNRKQALKIFANINRIFDDYLKDISNLVYIGNNALQSVDSWSWTSLGMPSVVYLGSHKPD